MLQDFGQNLKNLVPDAVFGTLFALSLSHIYINKKRTADIWIDILDSDFIMGKLRGFTFLGGRPRFLFFKTNYA